MFLESKYKNGKNRVKMKNDSKKGEMMKKIENETFSRSATLTRSSLNEQARTIEICFSSEDPYQRYFGMEILSHKKADVNMSFMNSGTAPFLAGHDRDDQIGVIEKAWIDPDKKGRALVRFSKSARAEEYFQDVLDGIRQNISVGYTVTEAKLLESKDGELDTYRMKWVPHEASLVSVPADKTVGVGRSDSNNKKENFTMSNTEVKTQTETIREAELARIGEITALGKAHGFEADAEKAIADGQEVDQFRSLVLTGLKKNGPKPVENFNPGMFGNGQQQEKQFPFLEYIRSQIPGSQVPVPQEVEQCRGLAKKSGRNVRGTLIPMGQLSRGLTVGTDTAGGHTVATDLRAGSMIDMLQSRMLCQRLGATVFTDLVGDVAIPRQTATATAYYVDENEDITNSDQAFDQVTLSPTTIGARTTISRKALLQSSLNLEQFVKLDLMTQLAQGLDKACIQGTGTNSQPTGILNVTGIGAVVGGTNGLAPTWENVVDLWSEIANDNADVGALGYLTNSKVVGKLMQTEKASGTAEFVASQIPNQEGLISLAGSRCGVSNNVPSTLTKGSASGVCSAIIYGNWADLLIGIWGGIDVIIDPYSSSASGAVHITAFLSFDLAVRHAESFAAMQDVLTA